MKLPGFCLFLLLPAVSLAGDGVLEINQACVADGCFPGDDPGFPVTISSTGSYRLTSNLGMLNQDVTAILITAHDVTLNLGGFRIACTVFTPPVNLDPCSSSGSGVGRGVEVDDVNTRRGVEVRNGSIVGMRSHGVYLGVHSVARDLRVSLNGRSGVFVSSGSRVSANTIWENGDEGIRAFASTVAGNTVYDNGGDGIDVSSSVVSGNSVYANDGNGISGGSGNLIEGNVVRNNTLFGLDITTSGYRGNILTDNMSGNVRTIVPQVGSINLGENACRIGFIDPISLCP